MRHVLGTLVLCASLISRQAACAGNDLGSRIEAVINRIEYRQAHWGVLVVDAQTGEKVYAYNPDKLFFPASTTKLYSCSAALAALGPD